MIVKAHQLPPLIAALLDAAALRYHVPASLARAVAWIESRGDAKARSSAGAMGVMQLMPVAVREFKVSDPFDPSENIDAGVKYLGRLLEKYRNEQQALAAYNWGPGNLDKAIANSGRIPEQVQNYVRNVQSRKVEEGSRSAGSPFFGCSQLELLCPHCSNVVHVVAEMEIRR